MDSPNNKNTTEVKSPNKKEVAKMDSPKKQEITEMNSPKKQEITEMKSPKNQEIAEIYSPKKQEITEMDSPKKQEITEMVSPKKQEATKINSPNKPETAEMDSPKKQEIAGMDSPSKQETANMDWKMRQMKIEMNATLEEKQRRIDDLTFKLTMLERENNSLNLKLDLYAIQMENREKLLETLMEQRDTLKGLVLKQLKQKNDDQEQTQRILNSGIENFQQILDQAYKLDIDEKGVMQEKLQRLMGETRDLKQKLDLKTCYVTPTVREAGATSSMISSMNSTTWLPNGIVTNGELASATRVSGGLGNGNEYNQQQSLPSSDKIPALHFLAKMIKDLNDIDAKLKTYEKIKPMPQEDRSSKE